MGCVFLWIHFTVIHSFHSNFRSVLKLTQAHEWPIRLSMWIFLSCYIRHSFTIPKGLLLVLYSNGLARYPSPWLVRGHDTCQVGFALIPRLVLVLQTPLLSWGFLGATVGRASTAPFPRVLSRWGVFWRGHSSGPWPFWFVLWPIAWQTVAHCSVGSRIVLGLHYRFYPEGSSELR